MSKEPVKHDQLSLTLRAAAGLYLIYSAWKLRNAVAEQPLFLIPIIAFAAFGLWLTARSGWRLWKGDYRKPGTEEDSEQ